MLFSLAKLTFFLNISNKMKEKNANIYILRNLNRLLRCRNVSLLEQYVVGLLAMLAIR